MDGTKRAAVGVFGQRIALTIVCCLFVAYAGEVFAAADPIGEWLVAKGIARIRIVNCVGKLWGVVSWEQHPGVDKNNPDRTKQNRPTLGMPVLLEMSPTKSNTWEGQIYNAKDGKTYSASIQLPEPDTLKVQGCFLGFLCGGENWTRVREPVRASHSNQATGSVASHSAQPDSEICLRLVNSAGRAH